MEVLKTIKLYQNGAFVRTESGRVLPENKSDGKVFANLCKGSKKDLRNAAEAADKAFAGWQKRTPFNRSQIIYRMAEMMESKREEFSKVYQEVFAKNPKQADSLIDEAINSIVYFAGFCDKYQAILGNVNPVNGPYLNYTVPESVGVSFIAEDGETNLANICTNVAAAMASGNTMIVLFGNPGGSFLAPLAEVLATSDVPAGVVNLMNGDFSELVPCAAKHREIQLLKINTENDEIIKSSQEAVIGNLKRISFNETSKNEVESIKPFLEMKTVWHPMGY